MLMALDECHGQHYVAGRRYIELGRQYCKKHSKYEKFFVPLNKNQIY
ncbi:hypothetical protein ALC53_12540 [Atta colombica]|uniref:Uncharacterized protein n=1 Tax=Atta colombica TaxID=520822 RepID=A0A151HYX9_9HYME|nr:hypothetical protein ALC53_12540 [Atta colombica]